MIYGIVVFVWHLGLLLLLSGSFFTDVNIHIQVNTRCKHCSDCTTKSVSDIEISYAKHREICYKHKTNSKTHRKKQKSQKRREKRRGKRRGESVSKINVLGLEK